MIGIVDACGYGALVRQVFAQLVVHPLAGFVTGGTEAAAGLTASSAVPAALEAVAANGLALDGRSVTLACQHLALSSGSFARTMRDGEMLAQHPRLAAWGAAMAERSSARATDPGLATVPRRSAGDHPSRKARAK